MRISDWSSDVCSSDLDHEIHRHQIAADFRLAVADDDAVGLHQAILGENMARVGVDDHLVDLVNFKQGVEDPAEQGFSAEFTEVLAFDALTVGLHGQQRSEEHTSELQSLMRISYAAFCLKQTKHRNNYY